MTEMATRIATLWPEILMLITAFAAMILGLSPNATVRRGTAFLTAGGLVGAGLLVVFGEGIGLPALTPFAYYVKLAVIGVGLLLLLAAIEVPDENRGDLEAGQPFDAGLVSRGEFYGFFMLSLVGAMLCATADDLIWLFLALELTSLPTYVMVATARYRIEAPEAGVKYFFLGAFAAAIFLYGFALLYGATGTTMFTAPGESDAVGISAVFRAEGVSTIAMLGLLLAIVGVSFKTAAVPMHFYAADVYQGAATPITAFLAFVPKTAGFLALIALLNLVGWPLDAIGPWGDALVWLLWIMAVLTMFVGNTMALRQDNVKRVLAYSSIAHTGYMMVGLLAGPGLASDAGEGLLIRNGIAAVLFYLVVYGVMNLGAFAVLGVLKARGEEAQTYDDLRGLVRRHPGLATIMAICVLSLTGIPPIVGFWGKMVLVGSAIGAGSEMMIWLVVLLVLASAIAAVYYLRIIAACFLPEPSGQTREADLPWRVASATIAAIVVVVLSFTASWLLDGARTAAALQVELPAASSVTQAPASADPSAEAFSLR